MEFKTKQRNRRIRFTNFQSFICRDAIQIGKGCESGEIRLGNVILITGQRFSVDTGQFHHLFLGIFFILTGVFQNFTNIFHENVPPSNIV
ncbi:hypothetical protein COPCOM_01494 [Coprococcus comes ATCC 27758]|uniref:Uncharacterized protein n=1 Tax=Coprococcus comes ATCC 27758 TaxID=470146 RepID=C0B8M0_9FIRM|nr:hypothetical protein COPCOM_01494 [Coprococcus comes ATCC 27758]